jgi:hypothetical protein
MKTRSNNSRRYEQQLQPVRVCVCVCVCVFVCVCARAHVLVRVFFIIACIIHACTFMALMWMSACVRTLGARIHTCSYDCPMMYWVHSLKTCIHTMLQVSCAQIPPTEAWNSASYIIIILFPLVILHTRLVRATWLAAEFLLFLYVCLMSIEQISTRMPPRAMRSALTCTCFPSEATKRFLFISNAELTYSSWISSSTCTKHTKIDIFVGCTLRRIRSRNWHICRVHIETYQITKLTYF